MVVGGGLRPRFQIRLAAEINASESVTKCAVTNADSVVDGAVGGGTSESGQKSQLKFKDFFHVALLPVPAHSEDDCAGKWRGKGKGLQSCPF